MFFQLCFEHKQVDIMHIAATIVQLQFNNHLQLYGYLTDDNFFLQLEYRFSLFLKETHCSVAWPGPFPNKNFAT